MNSDDEDLDLLLVDAAPRPDADAARALAAARERVLGLRASTRLGRYVLGELLGSGGMGKVYRARDNELDRDVAVKLIRSGLRPDALRREAMVLAHLSHPNIVRVFDVGRTPQDDSVFLVMELVRGGTLRTWLDARRSTAAIVAMFQQVARGLAAAHHAGIVHGDVKPSNVLVTNRGDAKLVDFGLARLEGDLASTGDDGSRGSTQHGGTPGFMAPEQLEGEPCDARGDQFAFCVALRDALAMADDVPRAVARVLDRGLERAPSQRWRSMDDVVAQLGTPSESGRRLVVALAVATVAFVPLSEFGRPATHHAGDPCPPFEGAWTESGRAEIDAAIRGTSRPWSIAMAALVVERLDRRSEAVEQAWNATCSAPPANATSTQLCLARVASALADVTELLANGSPALMLRAPTILAVVESADECAVPTSNETWDPSAAAAWRHELAAGLVALDQDMPDTARTIAVEIQDRAVEGMHARIAAEALWLQGASARAASDPQADAILRRAVDSAAAAGAAAVEFLATVELGELVLVQGRSAAAQHWGEQAEALAERLPEPDLARARALMLRASIDRVAARGEAAQAAAEQARLILEASLGGDHPDVAAVRGTLGQLALVRGDRATALAELCGAHEILRASLGDSDAATLEAEMRCAMALLHGEPREGHRRLSALLPRLEAALGADDVRVATALTNLGIAEKLLGDPAAAVERHQQADAIFERAAAVDHPGRVGVLANLGSALLLSGQPERAELAYVRATALAGTVLGETHLHTAQVWIGLAETRLVLDRIDGAIEAGERALAIQQRGGFGPARLAEAETILAEAFVAARRELPRARSLATSAERTLRARSVETKEYRRIVALLAALDRIGPKSARGAALPRSAR